MRNYFCDGCGVELEPHDIKIFEPLLGPVPPKFDLCSTCYRRAFEAAAAVERIHEIKISAEREKTRTGGTE